MAKSRLRTFFCSRLKKDSIAALSAAGADPSHGAAQLCLSQRLDVGVGTELGGINRSECTIAPAVPGA